MKKAHRAHADKAAHDLHYENVMDQLSDAMLTVLEKFDVVEISYDLIRADFHYKLTNKKSNVKRSMKRKTAMEAMGLPSAASSTSSSNSSLSSRSGGNTGCSNSVKRPRVLHDMDDEDAIGDGDYGAAGEEEDDDVVF